MKKGIKILLVCVLCVVFFNVQSIYADDTLKITENSTGVTVTGGGKTFNYTKEEFQKYFGGVSSYSDNTISENDVYSNTIYMYLAKIKDVQKDITGLPNRYEIAQCYEKQADAFLDDLLDIIDNFKTINNLDSYYTTNLYNKTSSCGDFEAAQNKTTYENAINESKSIMNAYLTFKSNFESLDDDYTNTDIDDDTDIGPDIIVEPDKYKPIEDDSITDDYYRPQKPSGTSNTVDGVITGVNKVWSSVILIVQIVSVACVVIAGVRYMFASADKKADIKKGVMYLIIGAIFVFAASTVIRFIYNIWQSTINNT